MPFAAPWGLHNGPHVSPRKRPIPSAYPASGTLGGHFTGRGGHGTKVAGTLFPGRKFFTDPALRRVDDTALINNRDLRIAMLNIELTRAQYRVQRADLLPTIDATGRSSHNGFRLIWPPLAGTPYQRQYSATLGFSAFELDLFGRIRSLTEALEIYSVENDARTAQLSLVAETAGVYLQLVADRELYDITVRTYESRKAQYDLVQNKLSAGVASDLEVQQARGVMEDARSNMARYATRVGPGRKLSCVAYGRANAQGYAGYPASSGRGAREATCLRACRQNFWSVARIFRRRSTCSGRAITPTLGRPGPTSSPELPLQAHWAA